MLASDVASVEKPPPRFAVLAVAAGLVALITTVASAGAGNGSGQGAPKNFSAPSISGSPSVGSTLAGNPGIWGGAKLSFAFAWQRCDANGGNCAPVSGATSTRYVVATSDVNRTLRLVAYVSNRSGTSTVSSPPTVVVPDPASTPPPTTSPPTSASAPQVTGTPQVGVTLSSSQGGWSGSPTSFGYQWNRCASSGSNCTAIAGATSHSYAPSSADSGATVRVSVTASNAGGSGSATSAATAVITSPPGGSSSPAAPGSVSPPQISGTAQSGQTLASSTGSWSGSPTSYSYAWSRCDGSGSNCVSVGGATGAAYALTSNDVGSTLRVSVAATNAGGTTTAGSAASATVTAPAPAPVPPPPPPPAPSSSRFGISAGGGIQNLSSTDLAHYLDLLQAAHVGWLRFDINWNVVQSAGPTSYNWTPFDNVVNAAASRGIKSLAILDYSPSWARSGSSSSATPPTNLADYATFAKAAAQHYSQLGVHDYEIWNEPNVGSFWSTGPSAAQYTQMLKLAYPAVKNGDPNAFVISAGLSPYGSYGSADSMHVNPITFLEQMYADGAKGYMDAVGWHPYAYPYGVQLAAWSGWSQMNQTSTSARSVMTANGDGGKQLWATEFGEPTGSASTAVSEAVQAQYVTDAYGDLKGVSWAGPAFFYSGVDLGTDQTNVEDNFGIIRHDWTPKPAYSAYQSAAAAG